MKSNKGIASVILVILALLLVSATYLTYKYYKPFKTKSNKLKEELNPISQNREEKEDNYETIVNNMLAYKLKHHKLLTQPPKEAYGYPPWPHSFSVRKNNINDWCSFSILSSEYLDNFDGEIELNTGDEKYTKKNVTIDGIDATEFTYNKVGDATSKSIYVTNAPFTYRMGYNFKKGGELASFCQTEAEKIIDSFTFLDRPNFFEKGNLTDVDGTKYNLVYEKPGKPALSVEIDFSNKSLCKSNGSTYRECKYSDFSVGDRVDVWGYKTGDKVGVLKMTEL